MSSTTEVEGAIEDVDVRRINHISAKPTPIRLLPSDSARDFLLPTHIVTTTAPSPEQCVTVLAHTRRKQGYKINILHCWCGDIYPLFINTCPVCT